MHRTAHGAAGLAVALVSLLLLAAPVWAAKPSDAGAAGSQGAANGSGNSGSVKVVDADSGLESTTDNEPHVCTFYLHFHEAPDGENGTWAITDWPPTGSGEQVAAGTYAIPPGGSFVTGSMALDSGHYRLNWQAVNATTEKHKTFWVDTCEDEEVEDEQPEDQPEDEPEGDVEDSVDQLPTEEEPADQPEDEPEGDVEDSVEELSTGEEQPEDQPDEQPQEQPQDPPSEEQSDAEQPADPDGELAPSITDEPVVDELPDTAMEAAPVLPGLGAAIGILLLVIAHRTILDRTSRSAERE